MKRVTMKRLFALVLCCTALGLAGTAEANYVDLQVGTGWVSGSNSNIARTPTNTIGDIDGEGDDDDEKDYLSFDLTTPITPTTGYQSGKFYGGFATLRYDGTFGSRFRINDGTPDDLVLGSNAGGSWNSYDNVAALFWKKEDFLTGGAASLTSDTALSVYLDGGLLQTTPGSVQWLVQVAGTFYISEESHGFVQTSDFAEISSTGLTTTAWRSIDLVGDIENDPSATLTTDLDLSNIDGVGVYINNVGRRFGIAGFTATPEPATMGLLGLGGLGILIRKRRR